VGDMAGAGRPEEANPGHYTDWTLSPATGPADSRPRDGRRRVSLSGTLAPAPAGPPGGPGIAAWADPAAERRNVKRTDAYYKYY